MKSEKQTPICIYHGNCADGFTSAWVVWLRFPKWEFYPGIHQNPPPNVTGRDVVIVDFSYKRPILDQITAAARSVLVLDHHKSAAADLADLPPARGTWESHIGYLAAPGCSCVGAQFDMGRSGAGITWDYFHPDEARPAFINYVEDRDLWRFALRNSREINAWILSHEYDFDTWNYLRHSLEIDFPTARSQGAAIERKHHKDITELVKTMKRQLCIGGQIVPAANIPYTLVSDAAHMMCEPENADDTSPPFAACYWHTPEGVVFGLRSIEGGMDVSEIAKQYGGGGHKHAAGFRISFAEASKFDI